MLNFDEILVVLRTIRNIQIKTFMQKEKLAARKTGFSRQEVQEFKQIFCSKRGGDDLSPQDIAEMLMSIVSTGVAAAELEDLCYSAQHAFSDEGRPASKQTSSTTSERHPLLKMVSVKFADAQNGCWLDFPAFLWLMKKILDIDFGQVNSGGR